MNLTFIELPYFEKFREEAMNDDEYRTFQSELLDNPEKGDVISGTGGLRKVRVGDSKRNKGKRGGGRVIYYYYVSGAQIWFFTGYGKDEKLDLKPAEKQILADMLTKLKALAEAVR